MSVLSVLSVNYGVWNHNLFIAEELTLNTIQNASADWEKDFQKLLEPLIEPNTPCYVLFRTDVKTPTGHEWLLLSWSPDAATIRQKMLYASTKATLKNEFGSTYIKEEMHATSKVRFNVFRASGFFFHLLCLQKFANCE